MLKGLSRCQASVACAQRAVKVPSFCGLCSKGCQGAKLLWLVLKGLSRCQASVACAQRAVKVPSFCGTCTNNEGSDQPGQMPRLILVFAECTGYFFGIVMLHLSVVYNIDGMFVRKFRMYRFKWPKWKPVPFFVMESCARSVKNSLPLKAILSPWRNTWTRQ